MPKLYGACRLDGRKRTVFPVGSQGSIECSIQQFSRTWLGPWWALNKPPAGLWLIRCYKLSVTPKASKLACQECYQAPPICACRLVFPMCAGVPALVVLARPSHLWDAGWLVSPYSDFGLTRRIRQTSRGRRASSFKLCTGWHDGSQAHVRAAYCHHASLGSRMLFPDSYCPK